MKTLTAFVVGLIMAMLVGCGNKADKTTNEAQLTELKELITEVANNQVTTDKRIEALRAGTLGSVTNLVEVAVAKAMEPFNFLTTQMASNQVETTKQIEALRVETLSSVTNLVEASVAKAMEPFQHLLTNPPPIVANPPPAPVVAPAKPPVVIINNKNMVTTTTQVVERAESPSVVINNQNNWMGGGSLTAPGPLGSQPPPSATGQSWKEKKISPFWWKNKL